MNIRPASTASTAMSRDLSSMLATANLTNSQRPSETDVANLATGFGVSAAQMKAFLAKGGELALSSDSAALQRLPIGKDGAPDFEAIVAAGGTVKGAIPPLGLPKMTIVDDRGQTTYYAAEVSLGNGDSPTYIKGVNVRANSSNKESDNYNLAATALKYYNKLPTTMEEALRRSSENFFDIYCDPRSFDAKA